MKDKQAPMKKKVLFVILVVSFAVGAAIAVLAGRLFGSDGYLWALIFGLACIAVVFGTTYLEVRKKIRTEQERVAREKAEHDKAVREKKMADESRRAEVIGNLLRDGGFMTPDEFFSMHRYAPADRANNGPGVYLIFNRTKKKCEVNTSMDIVEDAYSQLTGKGDKTVYEEYRRGDVIGIKLIGLKDSGFATLIELERACYLKIQAHVRGL